MVPETTSYEEALDSALSSLREIILRRHRRYGHNLLRHGELGIVIRVDDKTERIQNMLQQQDDDHEEPREATWLDIAGYAVQAVLIRRNQFTLPMEDGVDREHLRDFSPSPDRFDVRYVPS